MTGNEPRPRAADAGRKNTCNLPINEDRIDAGRYKIRRAVDAPDDRRIAARLKRLLRFACRNRRLLYAFKRHDGRVCLLRSMNRKLRTFVDTVRPALHNTLIARIKPHGFLAVRMMITE